MLRYVHMLSTKEKNGIPTVNNFNLARVQVRLLLRLALLLEACAAVARSSLAVSLRLLNLIQYPHATGFPVCDSCQKNVVGFMLIRAGNNKNITS